MLSGRPVSYTHLDVYKRQYLDHAHTGIPRAFWDSELRDVDELSQVIREAGQEYL